MKKRKAIAIQAKASWEQKWEDLVKAAQKEGRLSIYSGLERDTVLALRKGFGKKYAIDMDILVASSAELTSRLFTARSTGQFLADVYVEGPDLPLEFKQKGIIQPLDEAIFRHDVLDEKTWWHGYGPYFDKGHYLAAGTRTAQPAIIINKNMVSPEELTSYDDLLKPRWKGKIILGDPISGGGGPSTMLSALEIMGEDYIRKLREQVGMITRDKRLLVDWVAQGKYPVGFGGGTSTVIEFINNGVPVEMVPFREGHGLTSSGVVVIFDRPPNPNAARLFANWFLTRDAQQVYSMASGKMSRRLDVNNDHMRAAQMMKEGAKYIIHDDEYYLKRPQLMEIIKKYYLKR